MEYFEQAIIQCLRHVLQLDGTIESLIALIDMIYKQPLRLLFG